MKNLVPLFEEYVGKHLLIVDVQTPFEKWWIKNGKPDFIKDLFGYCEGFEFVYQIWDGNQESKPSYDFPNQITAVKKEYGGKLEKEDIRKMFDRDAQPELFQKLENDNFDQEEIPMKYGGSLFYIGGRGMHRENLGHDWFYASEKMLQLFDSLKRANSAIIIVGGADHECLYDIEVCLTIRDIPFERHEEFIYHA